MEIGNETTQTDARYHHRRYRQVLALLHQPFNNHSLIIGVIWGAWHLPLFWLPGNFHQTIPLSLFLLQSVALAVIYTWLHNNTKGSLLIALLFHTASNVTLGVLPVLPMDTGGDLVPLWLTVGLLWGFTIVITILSARASMPLAKHT